MPRHDKHPRHDTLFWSPDREGGGMSKHDKLPRHDTLFLSPDREGGGNRKARHAPCLSLTVGVLCPSLWPRGKARRSGVRETVCLFQTMCTGVP
jgi:hypothetical protein